MKSFKSIFGYVFNIPSPDDFWALNDVSFSLKHGEVLGIIGPNGAGKSTILKIIAHVTKPSRGQVKVSGRVGPLIEIGAGLHPELTGKENIYLYGSILGMRRCDIRKKFDEIVEFSGLKDFLNTPVKFYSSGMYLRLGFSVTIFTDPDILLIDEVLAVGDENFQKKCINKMEELIKTKKTIVFISHNLNHVARICKKVIYLDYGKIKSLDDNSKSISLYLNSLNKQTMDSSVQNISNQTIKNRWGNGQARTIDIWTEDSMGNKTTVLKVYQPITIKVRVKFFDSMKDPVFGIVIRDNNLKDIFFTNTLLHKITTGYFDKGSEKIVEYYLDEGLPQNNYIISPAIASSDTTTFYDWLDNELPFVVQNQNKAKHYSLHHKIKLLSS